jgi:hypothetical protein
MKSVVRVSLIFHETRFNISQVISVPKILHTISLIRNIRKAKFCGGSRTGAL